VDRPFCIALICCGFLGIGGSGHMPGTLLHAEAL